MQVGDVVVSDKGEGVILKIDGKRARVEIKADKSTVWREFAKLSLVDGKGAIPMPSTPKSHPPLPAIPSSPMMLSPPPEPSVSEMKQTIQGLRHISIESDRSAPVIEKDTKIQKNAMPQVISMIQGGRKSSLKHTTTSDKSLPKIDESVKMKFDVRSSMHIELKQGAAFTKLLKSAANSKDAMNPELARLLEEDLPEPAQKRRPTMSAFPKVLKFELANLDMFIIKRTLGVGNFGQVRLVQDKASLNHFALKVLKKSEIIALKEVDHVKNEKTLLQLVNHPFLVNM